MRSGAKGDIMRVENLFAERVKLAGALPQRDDKKESSYRMDILSPKSSSDKPLPEEKTEVGFIQSPSDLARLEIVDWRRHYHNYWPSPTHAVDAVGSRFIGFRYSILFTDLGGYPERDDFPQWNHRGTDHYDIGHWFWNFFKFTFDGELYFRDQPDLSGFVYNPTLVPDTRSFWGDIGRVSAITLLDTRASLFASTFWVSVVDENMVVFLEPPPWLSKE